MAGGVKTNWGVAHTKSQRGAEESPIVKWTLVTIAFVFSLVFLVLPLANVFYQALSKGWVHYVEALKHPDSLSAMRLTLIVAAITVPLNVIFGLAAAWCIAKFEFPFKSLL